MSVICNWVKTMPSGATKESSSIESLAGSKAAGTTCFGWDFGGPGAFLRLPRKPPCSAFFWTDSSSSSGRTNWKAGLHPLAACLRDLHGWPPVRAFCAGAIPIACKSKLDRFLTWLGSTPCSRSKEWRRSVALASRPAPNIQTRGTSLTVSRYAAKRDLPTEWRYWHSARSVGSILPRIMLSRNRKAQMPQ